MLYNAYPPFKNNYIIDSHVFPCFKDSYSKLFSLFSKSDVDVSASCRIVPVVNLSGGAVLSRMGLPSNLYWKEVYKWMCEHNCNDDQTPMFITSRKHSNQPWKYRWLSSNWFWASHGMTENGQFIGSAQCYRSSILVTGPIMWIHGDPSQCQLMNGENNSIALKTRSYFVRVKCNMTERGPRAVLSEREMDELVFPYRSPHLNWNITKNPYSLFWDQ